MAIFSNQATLTYNGNSTNSNIAYGEILDVLVATKTSVEGTYTPGELVTYVVTLRNTGNAALAGLMVTDDLGGYPFGGTIVYPLTYEPGSIAMFVNGVPQAAPAVAPGPPLVISGITVPAGGDVVLVYQARANGYANPTLEGTILNTVTVTGDGLSAPITATATVTAEAAPGPVHFQVHQPHPGCGQRPGDLHLPHPELRQPGRGGNGQRRHHRHLRSHPDGSGGDLRRHGMDRRHPV